MYALIISVHIVICFSMVVVILLQSGKGGGLAGAFGGGGSTIFGGRGATTVLTRATMVLGASFFITSLVLALSSNGRTGGTNSKSLLQKEAERTSQTQPGGQGASPTAPQRTTPQGVPQRTLPQAAPQTAPQTAPQPAAPSGGGR